MSCQARRWTANLAAIAAAMACYSLLRFPPDASSLYPRCPVFAWLHLYCPGCGSTRAAAALLHGRLGEAFHWNAMFVVLLPFVAAFSGLSYWRALQEAEFHWPRVPDSTLKLVLMVVAVFTVVRNLPAR